MTATTPNLEGRRFWIGLAVGGAVIGVGVVGGLRAASSTKPLLLTAWLLGGLLAHDALIAPLACLIGIAAARAVPASARVPLQAGLFASAIVIAVAYPALRGYGRSPDNPTVQPLDYATATLTVLAVVWASAAVWTGLRVLRTRPTEVALVVIAKAPVPGRSKTRLCPPCTPTEAALVARAALEDTLDVVARTPGVGRRIVALDGQPGPWLPDGFEVVPQPDGGLAPRLAGTFAAVHAPALLIAMDTPQVTPKLLDGAARTLAQPDVDAVLGLSEDGGYWAIGLARADGNVFDDVPMSSPRTGAAQLSRLRELGLRTELLPRLRDVDDFEDALAVARTAPGSRFATAVDRISARRNRPGARRRVVAKRPSRRS